MTGLFAATMLHGRAGDGPDARSFVLDSDTMTTAARLQWMPLVRLATLLLNDRAAAEEVVQSSFEAVWRRQPDVRAPEQLTSYLRTSVVNGCRSVGRRRGTAARHLALLRVEHDLPADTGLLQREQQREVQRTVARLPRRQREVLILRYWAGLSEADIARTLDISIGTVKSTAHHALTALRSHLEGQP